MFRSDILTLVKASPEVVYNEHGFPTMGNSILRRTVYGEMKSISTTEFYKAAQAGICAALKFKMWKFDFEGETLAEYHGRLYQISRTYEIAGSDEIELTLSDQAQKGAAVDTAVEGGALNG